jgi:hypothetical protein
VGEGQRKKAAAGKIVRNRRQRAAAICASQKYFGRMNDHSSFEVSLFDVA